MCCYCAGRYGNGLCEVQEWIRRGRCGEVRDVRVGIIYRAHKDEIQRIVIRLRTLLEERNLSVLCASLEDLTPESLLEKWQGMIDVVVVVGGDGTLLGAARQLAPLDIPVLGINAGNLGFLAAACPEQLEVVVDGLQKGTYSISERPVLHVVWPRRNAGSSEVVGWEEGIALNDASVLRGGVGRTIVCQLEMDGSWLAHTTGDGVVVATPTGSTGYALSCGGPILAPEVQSLVLAPVCPHTLSARPLVVPAEATLVVGVERCQGEVGLTLDGQLWKPLQKGDRVRVRCSRTRKFRLISLPGFCFYASLRDKLGWFIGDEGRAIQCTIPLVPPSEH